MCAAACHPCPNTQHQAPPQPSCATTINLLHTAAQARYQMPPASARCNRKTTARHAQIETTLPDRNNPKAQCPKAKCAQGGSDLQQHSNHQVTQTCAGTEPRQSCIGGSCPHTTGRQGCKRQVAHSANTNDTPEYGCACVWHAAAPFRWKTKES